MTDTSPVSHRIDGFDAVAMAVLQLLENSSRLACLFAPRLEPRLWNQPAIVEALRAFAISGREREIRILVGEHADLARDCGALVALHQRLPSLLQFRQPQDDHEWPALHPILAADGGSVLALDGDGRLGGDFMPSGSGQSHVFRSRFDMAWERARPMAELRVLGI